MKREICCSSCAKSWQKSKKYPGEYIRIKSGNALSNFYCDGCNMELERGNKVYAVSVYQDWEPTMNWEDIYIELKSVPDCSIPLVGAIEDD